MPSRTRAMRDGIGRPRMSALSRMRVTRAADIESKPATAFACRSCATGFGISVAGAACDANVVGGGTITCDPTMLSGARVVTGGGDVVGVDATSVCAIAVFDGVV